MYPRFEGMMSNLPTKAQDEALLIEKQRKLQRAEEQRRSFEALRDDFRNYLSKYNPQALNQHPPPHDSSPSSPIIQTTPVQRTKPPEPPDLKQSDLISATKDEEEPNPNSPITLTTLPHSPQPPDLPDFKRSRQKSSTKQVSRLKYSCDEIYERMENGLCIFCEEQDTPGHQQLKHKGFRILVVKCDDNQVSDDRESVESVLELPSVVLLPNGETAGSVIGSKAAIMETNLSTQSSLYTIGFEAELLCAKRLIETDLSIQERQSSDVKAMIVTDSIPNEEPSLEKDSKAAKVRPQVEMSPSSQVPNSDLEQMRNYKLVSHRSWDLEEFKLFDEKMSDKTPYIEDEQDAEYEKKEVMKLMSSWSNRVWEPGGVLIEHDEWKWLKKNRVMRVNEKLRLVEFLNDMWKLLICLGVQSSKLETYNSVRYNSIDGTNNCLEIMEFSLLQKLQEISLQKTQGSFIPVKRETRDWIVNEGFKVELHSGLDIAAWVSLGVYFNEYKKLMRLAIYQCLEVQELSQGYIRVLRKFCKNWHFKYKLNTWHSEVWRKRLNGKLQRASKHVMCELNSFNKICRLRKVGRYVMCDVSFWDNFYLVNSHEMFHSPRPPEFSFNKAASNFYILEDKDALKKGVLLQEESIETYYPVCPGYLS